MFRVFFTGNLGAEPKFIYTAKETAMMSASVAVSGGKDKPPLWMRVTVFGDHAEALAKLGLVKGMRVVVSSTRVPTIDQYEKHDGTVGVELQVIADYIEVNIERERQG